MKKIRSYRYIVSTVLTLCAFAFCITSCDGKITEDYRDRAFRCLIYFDTPIGEVCAEICVGSEYDVSDNRLTMTIISPETLNGLKLSSKGVTSYGTAFETGTFQGLFEYAELLIFDGQMKVVCKTEVNGSPAFFATAVNNNGDIAEIYIDKSNLTPMMIRSGDKEIRIDRFTYLP